MQLELQNTDADAEYDPDTRLQPRTPAHVHYKTPLTLGYGTVGSFTTGG